MQEHKINIGRDAFFDILRNHGLLVRRRKRSTPKTTFSHHWLRKYLNLIIGFIPNAPNQGGLIRYLTRIFLAGCSSAEPASASSGLTNVNGLQDYILYVNLN